MARSDALDAEFSLYRQVETILRDQIADGVLRPGDRLPSEEALRAQYGVSRGTLRQALEALERDGLVDRARGRGTFVTAGRSEESLRMRRDLGQMIAAAGTATRRDREGRAVPPQVVISALELGGKMEIPFFIRLTAAQGDNALGIKRYLAPELARHAEDLATEKDFDAILARLGKVSWGRAWVEAILAEPRFAMMLKVPLGSSLLSLWWVDLLDGRPAACTQMLRPGSSISLEIPAAGDAP